MLPFTNITPAQIKLYCEQTGYKRMEKKLFVAEKLCETADFIDAESLWLKLAMEQRTSLSTVYLVLSWLVMNGFAVKKLSGKRTFVYRIKTYNEA